MIYSISSRNIVNTNLFTVNTDFSVNSMEIQIISVRFAEYDWRDYLKMNFLPKTRGNLNTLSIVEVLLKYRFFLSF